MNSRLPNSEKSRPAVAYLSLLMVFWTLLLLLLGLSELMKFSFGVLGTKWGGDLLVSACLFLAVLVAHRIGEVSYFGVALAVLIGISGLIYFIMVSTARPGYALQMLRQSWLDLLVPVGVALIALLITRQLTNHSSGTPDGAP